MADGWLDMKPILSLSSPHNARVKEAIHLRDRRSRDETGRFLIEGYRELLRALEGGWAIEELFYCQELFLGENEELLLGQVGQRGGQLIACTSPLFHKLSYRDRPDGLVGVSYQKKWGLAECEKMFEGVASPFFLVAEAIEKPGNLGTMLRSMDAAGGDALILADPCTDLYNPNVIRASVGTRFTLPCFESTALEALAFLKRKKIPIFAATPGASLAYTEVDFRGAVAIAVGTEQLGLSAAWMEAADVQVRIPMRGAADSLNVAMAATLLLYEVRRQRG